MIMKPTMTFSNFSHSHLPFALEKKNGPWLQKGAAKNVGEMLGQPIVGMMFWWRVIHKKLSHKTENKMQEKMKMILQVDENLAQI